MATTIETTIRQIIDLQKDKNYIPVDIILSNGNILLKGFHILEFDDRSEKIKGLTMLEEYAHTREGREPVFCQFGLRDIKELQRSEYEYAESY